MTSPTSVPSILSIVIVFDAELLDRSDDSDDDIVHGDYTSVEVYFDTEKIQEYGDEYHDKGQRKAEAFVAGARHAWKGALDIDVPSPIVTSRVDRLAPPSSILIP
jgi:hypothetical protein